MLQDRGSAAIPSATLGVACVVAGGLVAAATALAPSKHGTWAAAYLVLVASVAQVALGVGQALLAPKPPSSRLVAAQFVGWNAGTAAARRNGLLYAFRLLIAVLLVSSPIGLTLARLRSV